MSKTTIQDLDVNYEIVGDGPGVVLLHGWGGCIASMSPIREMLRNKYRVLSVDLPGFGSSAKPPASWGSEEYAECVGELLSLVDFGPMISVLGHSFGGKVAIHLARRRASEIQSLVLVGAPGVRLPPSAATRVRISLVKVARTTARFLPGTLREAVNRRMTRLGSEDYRNAGEMRPILVRVVNEDLRTLLPEVGVSTLLIWGEHDDAAPLAIGTTMETLIPDAGLVVLANSGHFPYLDEPRAFSAILASFLGHIHEGGAV